VELGSDNNLIWCVYWASKNQRKWYSKTGIQLDNVKSQCRRCFKTGKRSSGSQLSTGNKRAGLKVLGNSGKWRRHTRKEACRKRKESNPRSMKFSDKWDVNLNRLSCTCKHGGKLDIESSYTRIISSSMGPTVKCLCNLVALRSISVVLVKTKKHFSKA